MDWEPLLGVFIWVIALYLLYKGASYTPYGHRRSIYAQTVAQQKYPIVPAVSPSRYREQLAAVTLCHNITAAHLFNKAELKVFYAARAAVTLLPGYYLHGQVSLAEFVRWDDFSHQRAEEARQAINSKRVDLLITDRYGKPALVIEHQGSGHAVKAGDSDRNEVKRAVLRRAAIPLLETSDNHSAEQIRAAILAALMSGLSARQIQTEQDCPLAPGQFKSSEIQ